MARRIQPIRASSQRRMCCCGGPFCGWCRRLRPSRLRSSGYVTRRAGPSACLPSTLPRQAARLRMSHRRTLICRQRGQRNPDRPPDWNPPLSRRQTTGRRHAPPDPPPRASSSHTSTCRTREISLRTGWFLVRALGQGVTHMTDQYRPDESPQHTAHQTHQADEARAGLTISTRPADGSIHLLFGSVEELLADLAASGGPEGGSVRIERLVRSQPAALGGTATFGVALTARRGDQRRPSRLDGRLSRRARSLGPSRLTDPG